MNNMECNGLKHSVIASKAKQSIFVVAVILFTLTGCTKKQGSENSIPHSIVALSPASVEILYSIGAENQISAVSEFSDYPPEAAEKPVVGGFDGKTISLEKILSFNPDFVYLTDGMHNFLIPQLENLNIRYYLSKANSVEAIKNEVLEIGTITGHKDSAQKVADKMTQSLLQAKTENLEIPVYYEVWNNPYISCGKNSFINDVLQLSGGKNIFDDVANDYPQVSEESIIARNPQVIFLTKSSGITPEDVKKRSSWQNISAVKNNHIFVIDDNISSRPSPRITEIIKDLNYYISCAKD